MNVGGDPAAPARQPGLRAAVNARLEEISFRTGLIGAAIALFALVAIAAAGVYVATAGHGSAAVAVSADNVPKTAPKASAAPLPSKPAPPSATAAPKAAKAAPGHPANSQPAAAAQSQVQATASAAASWPGNGWSSRPEGYGWTSQRGDGRGFDGDGRGFDGDGRGFGGGGQGPGGGGFQHGAPGFPGHDGSSGFGRGRGRH